MEELDDLFQLFILQKIAHLSSIRTSCFWESSSPSGMATFDKSSVDSLMMQKESVVCCITISFQPLEFHFPALFSSSYILTFEMEDPQEPLTDERCSVREMEVTVANEERHLSLKVETVHTVGVAMGADSVRKTPTHFSSN